MIIGEINDSQQRVFEGYCRGGPGDGKFVVHPLQVICVSRNGVWGRYIYAINGEWIWFEGEKQKSSGGILE